MISDRHISVFGKVLGLPHCVYQEYMTDTKERNHEYVYRN
jgi:hypothetical protein